VFDFKMHFLYYIKFKLLLVKYLNGIDNKRVKNMNVCIVDGSGSSSYEITT